MRGEPGWPSDFAEPRFTTDEEAVAFIRRQAAAGMDAPVANQCWHTPEWTKAFGAWEQIQGRRVHEGRFSDAIIREFWKS